MVDTINLNEGLECEACLGTARNQNSFIIKSEPASQSARRSAVVNSPDVPFITIIRFSFV